MKKLLGTTLALAMFVPAGANAELFKNIKVSGQLDVSAVSAHNVVDFVTRPTPSQGAIVDVNNDRIGHALTRTMVSLDWDLLDDVHARVTLVKGGRGTNDARTYGSASQAIVADNTGILNTTFVQEANVKIDKLAGHVDTTIGRQFFGEAGDLIAYYGPRDNYGFTVDAIDAFRFDWSGEHMAVTGLAGRTADGTLAQVGSQATSTDVRALIVSCKQHEIVKPTVYLWNRQNHATGGSGVNLPNVNGQAVTGKNTNLYVFGVKAKVATGGFTGSAEWAKNFGDDRTTFAGATSNAQSGKFTGWAFLAKAAYKADLSDVGAITPWGEYGVGTGDANFAHAGNGNFQSINTDFRPGGVYGRFDQTAARQLNDGNANGANGSAASNGLTNRIIWGLGVKGTPSALNKLTAGLAYWRYAFHRMAPNAGGVKLSRNIGSEVDATFDWKHSENVNVGVTVGQFLPGAHIAGVKGANAALNPARLYAADVKVKF